MDPNKCLPPELTVQSVEDILHRSGLTLDSTKSYPKRKLFFNPIIIFTFLLLFTIREVIVISLPEENDLIFKVFGSFGYLIGIREFAAISYTLLTLLSMSFHLIYYYNYRNGIKPTFLRVFQMMSGLVSPKSLDLTDEQQITKLLNRTKFSLKCARINNKYIFPLSVTTIVVSIYIFKTNLIETVYFGFPNALLLATWVIHFFNSLTYQCLLFYILCLYLKMKINSLNERLIEMKRRKQFIRIRETLQSFDSLYSEINEYNTTFWSKILFTFCTLLGTVIVFVLFVCLFIKVDLINLCLFSYALFILSSLFLLIIFTASSVNYCANKSYKTLNSLIISYTKHNKHFYYRRVSTKFKVINKH